MPFGGPELLKAYTDWFIEHGIVFSVFMGIGQRISKQNASAPDCRYYLHCPTYDYPVIPMLESDELNAEALLKDYIDKVDHKLHLILSATFPNLQRSGGAKETLEALDKVAKDLPLARRAQRLQACLSGQRLLFALYGSAPHRATHLGW